MSDDASILFLDMDGVILAGRHHRAARAAGTALLDHMPDDTMALLNKICAETGCLIVSSSVWRSDNFLRQKFKEHGFTGQFHRDWRTPHLDRAVADTGAGTIYGVVMRGDEIADWIKRNRPVAYAIVDDDSDMLPEQRRYFIKTDFETGLTDVVASALIRILNRASPSPTPQTKQETK